MSGEAPINLNKARKAKTKAEAEATAARNRAVHGRTKADRAATAKALQLEQRRLDNARREP